MNEKRNDQPPPRIHSLLRRFAREQTLEEVEGDLLEFYPQWVESLGRARANRKYFFTVLTLLRPFSRKRSQVSHTHLRTMIRSYFTMSWRTIRKNKVSSLINLSGLTLGLTTSLLILLVVMREFEYDRHNQKVDALFLMMRNQKTNDGIFTHRATAGPTAATLKADYSQVVHTARVAAFYDVPVVIDNSRRMTSGIYTDGDLFRMMTFTTISGNAGAALDGNAAVLSRDMAIKLFGNDDAVGRSITFGSHNSLIVGAVIENTPATGSLQFEMAVPFRVFENDNDWLTKWDDNRIQTWVELNSEANLSQFNNEVASLVTQKTGDNNETLFAYPLADLHLRGAFSNGQPSGGLITIIWVLVGFGTFMLLVACVNFMNLATAQSAHRAREVGVRKVLGAARRWIIFQFLHESLVITFMALIAAIVLTVLVIPSFNVMMHTSIAFEFDKTIVWVLCIAVALITALIAGSYPAFALSRFVPVRVLNGIVDRPGGSSLRRVLVTFQFVISISVLIGTIVLFAQFDYMRNRPMGYQQQNLVNVQLDSLAAARFAVVKTEVLKIAGVRAATGTGGNILYSGASITGMDWPGKKPGEDVSVSIAEAEYNWSETMGIKITEGRDFSEQFKSDERACLLNQTAVYKMGLENPVGSIVGGKTVVGVFSDFVYNNPSGAIEPLIVYLAPNNIHHLYVRIENNETWLRTLKEIEKAVKKASPEVAFEPRFTSDEYQARFQEMSDVGLMVSMFGGMTIFISCLGLFGLSGFIAERRGKEMSIRKVFGADAIRVLLALSTDILKPVVVALLIVIPLSVWVAGMVLNQVVYRVPLQWWMFAGATAMVLAVALLVVLYHGWRTAIESPSLRLKSE